MALKKLVKKMLEDFQSVPFDKLQEKVKGYSVVSFDIFDTLVKRDVKDPSDVFEYLGRIFNIQNFRQIRQDAELKARKRSIKNEISIADIYSEINFNDDLKDKILKKELQLEIDVSVKNKKLIEFYNYCLDEFDVILVSDMYLPHDTVKEILNKCGIKGYKKLYLSNDVNQTKAEGSLFQFVLSDLQVKPCDIVHIGNSFKADYLMAMKNKIHAIKINTNKLYLHDRYKNCFKVNLLDFSTLTKFISNHSCVVNDDYSQFGYEVFGPLLFGFVNWLKIECKDKNVEQILFLSRDGYIIKKAFERIDDCEISKSYFEVSRRSLRVPSYCNSMSYESVVSSLSVPSLTNIIQIFDSLGLNAKCYKDAILANGFDFNMHIKRDNLISDTNFKKLFEEIQFDIKSNAIKENTELLSYLKQFDFSLKTAIVDIGWAGSMQKYLVDSLNSIGINSDIIGYYVGLTKKSKVNLKRNKLKAFGYSFDCMNNDCDEELESSFIGLFETLFLEQKGSVMKYYRDSGISKAVRYEYEYNYDGELMPEASAVIKIQNAALDFVSDFNHFYKNLSFTSESDLYFNNLYSFGVFPSLNNVDTFGWFSYFNCGDKVYLAKPRSLLYYILHINKFKTDLYDSQWKIGFMKKLLKLPFNYEILYSYLRNISNKN